MIARPAEAKIRFFAVLLVFLSSSNFCGSAFGQEPSSKLSEILSFVEFQIPEIKDEPEDVRQMIIRETARLEAVLGRWDAALNMDIKDPNDRDMILSLVAVKKCEEGTVEEAESSIPHIAAPLYRIDAHIGMAASLPAKDVFRVQKHLREALDLFFFVENDDDKFDRQTKLAVVALEAGYLPKALDVVADVSEDQKKAKVLSQLIIRAKGKSHFLLLKSAIDATQDKFIRDELSEQLAFLEAESGLIQEALDHAAALPGPDRVRLLCRIALMRFQKKTADDAGDYLEMAEKVIDSISGNLERSSALGYLAAAQSKIGLKKEAAENFQEIKTRSARLPKQSLDRPRLLVEVSQGQVANGQGIDAYGNFYEAASLLTEANGASEAKARLFSKIAKGLYLLGHTSDAKDLFLRSWKWAKEVNGRENKIKLTLEIASDQAEAKLMKEAYETLGLAVQEARAASEEDERAKLLEPSMLLYTHWKDFGQAEGLLDFIPSPAKKISLFRNLLFELAKNGEDEQAIHMAKAQGSRPLRLGGLLGAASGILSKESKWN